jgi:hypothetical protein
MLPYRVHLQTTFQTCILRCMSSLGHYMGHDPDYMILNGSGNILSGSAKEYFDGFQDLRTSWHSLSTACYDLIEKKNGMTLNIWAGLHTQIETKFRELGVKQQTFWEDHQETQEFSQKPYYKFHHDLLRVREQKLMCAMCTLKALLNDACREVELNGDAGRDAGREVELDGDAGCEAELNGDAGREVELDGDAGCEAELCGASE